MEMILISVDILDCSEDCSEDGLSISAENAVWAFNVTRIH